MVMHEGAPNSAEAGAAENPELAAERQRIEEAVKGDVFKAIGKMKKKSELLDLSEDDIPGLPEEVINDLIAELDAFNPEEHEKMVELYTQKLMSMSLGAFFEVLDDFQKANNGIVELKGYSRAAIREFVEENLGEPGRAGAGSLFELVERLNNAQSIISSGKKPTGAGASAGTGAGTSAGANPPKPTGAGDTAQPKPATAEPQPAAGTANKPAEPAPSAAKKPEAGSDAFAKKYPGFADLPKAEQDVIRALDGDSTIFDISLSGQVKGGWKQGEVNGKSKTEMIKYFIELAQAGIGVDGLRAEIDELRERAQLRRDIEKMARDDHDIEKIAKGGANPIVVGEKSKVGFADLTIAQLRQIRDYMVARDIKDADEKSAKKGLFGKKKGEDVETGAEGLKKRKQALLDKFASEIFEKRGLDALPDGFLENVTGAYDKETALTWLGKDVENGATSVEEFKGMLDRISYRITRIEKIRKIGNDGELKELTRIAKELGIIKDTVAEFPLDSFAHGLSTEKLNELLEKAEAIGKKSIGKRWNEFWQKRKEGRESPLAENSHESAVRKRHAVRGSVTLKTVAFMAAGVMALSAVGLLSSDSAPRKQMQAGSPFTMISQAPDNVVGPEDDSFVGPIMEEGATAEEESDGGAKVAEAAEDEESGYEWDARHGDDARGLWADAEGLGANPDKPENHERNLVGQSEFARHTREALATPEGQIDFKEHLASVASREAVVLEQMADYAQRHGDLGFLPESIRGLQGEELENAINENRNGCYDELMQNLLERLADAEISVTTLEPGTYTNYYAHMINPDAPVTKNNLELENCNTFENGAEVFNIEFSDGTVWQMKNGCIQLVFRADKPGNPDVPDEPGEPTPETSIDVPDEPGIPDVPDEPGEPTPETSIDVPDKPDIPDVPDEPTPETTVDVPDEPGEPTPETTIDVPDEPGEPTPETTIEYEDAKNPEELAAGQDDHVISVDTGAQIAENPNQHNWSSDTATRVEFVPSPESVAADQVLNQINYSDETGAQLAAEAEANRQAQEQANQARSGEEADSLDLTGLGGSGF